MEGKDFVNHPAVGTVALVPDGDLARLHERGIPQKDQLCGPFWASLILTAANCEASQEEAALHAGTTLAEGDPASWLPPGASPRTDYAAGIPLSRDEATSGTSSSALARSIEDLSKNELAVVPVAGPWTADSVADLVEIAAKASGCTLIANLRTGRLWGSRPPAKLLLDHLLGVSVEAPSQDWDCGHFLTIAASLSGPGGAFLVLRDTYAQLGWGGYHLQPPDAVAAALERGDESEGGMLCVCVASGSVDLTERLKRAGFESRHWNNGTPDGERGQ